MQHFIKNEQAMARFGETLAQVLRQGDVLALRGALGAGKTTLARAIIRAHFGRDEPVPSPSYALVQSYQPQGEGLAFWHVDLFRIGGEEELPELGLEEAQEGVLLIEWPEKWGASLPPIRLDIEFAITSTSTRTLTLSAQGGDWRDRMAKLA